MTTMMASSSADDAKSSAWLTSKSTLEMISKSSARSDFEVNGADDFEVIHTVGLQSE